MSAFTSDNGHPREIKAATEALGIAIHAARATPASGRWNYCEAACLDPCAYQILHPAVLMMKSAEDQPSGKLTVRLVRSMARRIPTKGQMRPEFVVQQGLRTPTGLAFASFCIDGIRGLAFAFASTGRSTRPVVLFSVAR